jgi:hypothetical protein
VEPRIGMSTLFNVELMIGTKISGRMISLESDLLLPVRMKVTISMPRISNQEGRRGDTLQPKDRLMRRIVISGH